MAQQIDEPTQVTITGAKDEEWAGYRHAYQAAATFSAYVRERPLIQAQMQIRPLAKDVSMDGLRIELVGDKTSLVIPVDAIGRANLPMLKQAYDEDAVLRVNRPKGDVYFSGRFSIKEREDGVYDAAELRAACAQLIDAQRDSGYWLRLIGKKCRGVKFIYANTDAAPAISFQHDADPAKTLPVSEGHPFEDKSMGLYKVAIYRFDDWPEQGKITAQTRPIAIGTLYD